MKEPQFLQRITTARPICTRWLVATPRHSLLGSCCLPSPPCAPLRAIHDSDQRWPPSPSSSAPCRARHLTSASMRRRRWASLRALLSWIDASYAWEPIGGAPRPAGPAVDSHPPPSPSSLPSSPPLASPAGRPACPPPPLPPPPAGYRCQGQDPGDPGRRLPRQQHEHHLLWQGAGCGGGVARAGERDSPSSRASSLHQRQACCCCCGECCGGCCRCSRMAPP